MSADWHRIAKFAGMLGSAGDGEVVNAARAIDKALKAQGLTWGDFKARLEGGASYRPTGPQRPSQPRDDPFWEATMAEEEEKARQRASRRRKGREW